jgi:excisionase family DNA binding protein
VPARIYAIPSQAPRNGADSVLPLSVKEACVICFFGRTTFYKYLKLGNMRARKFGTRTIVPRDELEEALKSLPRAGRAS